MLSASEQRKYAPARMWDLALGQANRSNMHQHKTGAVVFDKRGRVLSKGCSFYGGTIRERTHAEHHAVGRMWPALDTLHARVLIVTLTRGGNWSYSSRPCGFCVNLLRHYNIQSAIWPEYDGGWIVREEGIEDMYSRIDFDITCERANQMRVVI
jgi:cytidine deaminase